MTLALISVGSNQNDPRAQILAAFDKLSRGMVSSRLSRMYLTEPVGNLAQDPFVNAAILLETDHMAPQLLDLLMRIETDAGRSRKAETPNGPRNLDLDIILFGDEVWTDRKIQIPHPRFRLRRFVLQPAVELAPEMIDPLSKKTISQLLLECEDMSWVKPLKEQVEAG